MHGLCRDKTRQLFAEALLLAREAAPDADVGMAAAEAESAMHRQNDGVNQRYKAKYRSLIFNLKDANNPDLRRRVLSGEITGAPLPGNLPFYWPAAPHNGCAEEVMQILANIRCTREAHQDTLCNVVSFLLAAGKEGSLVASAGT